MGQAVMPHTTRGGSVCMCGTQLWWYGAMVLWCYGAMVPCCYGGTVLWCYGAIVRVERGRGRVVACQVTIEWAMIAHLAMEARGYGPCGGCEPTPTQP